MAKKKKDLEEVIENEEVEHQADESTEDVDAKKDE